MNGFPFMIAMLLLAHAVAHGSESGPGPISREAASHAAFRGQRVGHPEFRETQRRLLSIRRRKLLTKDKLRKPCSAILSLEDPEQKSNKKLRKDTGISDCSDGDINTDLTAKVYPYVSFLSHSIQYMVYQH